jgi:hypothetical protein
MELDLQDWRGVHRELIRHGRRKIARFRWRRSTISPEDLATGAIAKLLEGKRVWNRREYPDVLPFLKGVVDSDLYHELVSLEHRVTEVDLPVQVQDERTPESQLLLGEDREVLPALRVALRCDPAALRVLDSFEKQSFEGSAVKQARAAAACGLPIAEVRNAVRRLRRQARATLKGC